MTEKYGKQVRELMKKEMKNVISNNKGFVFSSMENLKASDIDTFRKKMKQSGARYLLVKKRLAKIALEEAGLAELAQLTDQDKKALGMGVIKDDPVNVIKTMIEFSKSNKGFVVAGGYFDGIVLDAARVKQLSELPSREVLLSRLLGAMNGPITGFVGVSAGILRKFMYAINAIKDKKQGSNN
jgi:large subunit ribosomal protein L10